MTKVYAYFDAEGRQTVSNSVGCDLCIADCSDFYYLMDGGVELCPGCLDTHGAKYTGSEKQPTVVVLPTAREYLVQWAGRGLRGATWEPADEIRRCCMPLAHAFEAQASRLAAAVEAEAAARATKALERSQKNAGSHSLPKRPRVKQQRSGLASLRHGAWTPKEVNQLSELVRRDTTHTHGPNWEAVARALGTGRTGAAVRLRWSNTRMAQLSLEREQEAWTSSGGSDLGAKAGGKATTLQK